MLSLIFRHNLKYHSLFLSTAGKWKILFVKFPLIKAFLGVLLSSVVKKDNLKLLGDKNE